MIDFLLLFGLVFVASVVTAHIICFIGDCNE